MVYIGTKANGFTDYPIVYEGELTAEKLIQGIADLTGWDLTLAEDVISGKGGMSVCLSGESALFTGPPDPQREEFHMYDVGQLAETILDSIQKTLQEGFTLEGATRTRWTFGTTWRGIGLWSFPSWACPGRLTSPINGRLQPRLDNDRINHEKRGGVSVPLSLYKITKILSNKYILP